MKATGAKTKREAVKLGLETLVSIGKQNEIWKLRGKLSWDDGLDRPTPKEVLLTLGPKGDLPVPARGRLSRRSAADL